MSNPITSRLKRQHILINNQTKYCRMAASELACATEWWRQQVAKETGKRPKKDVKPPWLNPDPEIKSPKICFKCMGEGTYCKQCRQLGYTK